MSQGTRRYALSVMRRRFYLFCGWTLAYAVALAVARTNFIDIPSKIVHFCLRSQWLNMADPMKIWLCLLSLMSAEFSATQAASAKSASDRLAFQPEAYCGSLFGLPCHRNSEAPQCARAAGDRTRSVHQRPLLAYER